MRSPQFLLTIMISVIIVLALQNTLFKPVAVTAKKSETVYERIMRTKTLHCGYISWPPFSQKNPKTNKMEGMYVDLTEALAKGLGWKVEWTEEISTGDFITSLNAGRVDMMCAPMVPTAQRVTSAYFTAPHLYAPYRVYARADDMRFDNNIAAINDPNITISTMEGELTSIVAHNNFSNAKVLEISSQQGPAQLFENVATNKADVVFQDPFSYSAFNEQNKGRLRQVIGEDVGFFSAGYALKFGENELKTVIDTATQDLINRRYIEKLAKDYRLLEAGLYLTADTYKK